MRRYVLTGTPGSGKTAILRQLEQDGFAVVEEAATDVIALRQALGEPDPWTRPDFIDKIVTLQRQREQRVSDRGGACAMFVDRSPVCTLALARHLGWSVSELLQAEVDRVVAERVYAGVFFVRNLGFVEPTAARRISFDDALAFEDVHERTYRGLGFELIEVPAGPLASRVEQVRQVADFGAGQRTELRRRHPCR
jgi:predicted ATPase